MQTLGSRRLPAHESLGVQAGFRARNKEGLNYEQIYYMTDRARIIRGPPETLGAPRTCTYARNIDTSARNIEGSGTKLLGAPHPTKHGQGLPKSVKMPPGAEIGAKRLPNSSRKTSQSRYFCNSDRKLMEI